MRSNVLLRVGAVALAMIVAPCAGVVGADAVTGTDYDSFDVVTLNDVSSTDSEVPGTESARDYVSAAFDTTQFTLQPGEAASNGTLHGCLGSSGVTYSGRTGWVRFNPGANGLIDVRADTPGFDSVLAVFSAPETAWRSTELSQVGSSTACADRVAGAGGESVSGVAASGSRVYFVQVGGRCAGGPTTCQDASTPGGVSVIHLRFTPFDADGDGVPDDRDDCEGRGTPGRVTPNGCPDADVDGIADEDDSCPGAPGVPSASPYNGCPAGPHPPDPAVTPFVRIQSLEGDDYSTSIRRVRLLLNWPQGTTCAVIRNSGQKSRVRAVGQEVEWRLTRATRPANREVRVRFRGPRVPDVSVGDTIKLDPTGPEVSESLLLAAGQGWYVGLALADQGTGVSDVRLLDADGQSVEAEEICEQDDCENAVTIALSSPYRRPASVEVTDSSGNVTIEPLEVATASKLGCAGSPVPSRQPPSGWTCVYLRQSCGALKDRLRWWVSDEVRCRRVDGGPYEVVPR